MKTENFRPRTAADRVDPSLLAESPSQERRAFVVSNCRALADFLANLPPEQLEMADYTIRVRDIITNPDCGTRACAMGWAALSGVIPGLSWKDFGADNFEEPNSFLHRPTVNGEEFSFGQAARRLFGSRVHHSVFTGSSCGKDRDGVVEDLRAIADEIERGAESWV